MRTTPWRRQWPMVAAAVTASLLLETGDGTGETTEHQARLTGTVPANGLIVTVTEGPGEPRSIGSYALRLYEPLHPDFPYDASSRGPCESATGLSKSCCSGTSTTTGSRKLSWSYGPSDRPDTYPQTPSGLRKRA